MAKESLKEKPVAAYVKVDHAEKDCNWCGELFKPRTSHQNFCCKNCYRKYGKKYLGHSVGGDNVRKSPLIGPKLRKPHYSAYKKASCESCGFIAIDPCQLDVDHIDGNHKNNKRSNLQTLCANCHRLKTKLNGDGIYK